MTCVCTIWNRLFTIQIIPQNRITYQIRILQYDWRVCVMTALKRVYRYKAYKAGSFWWNMFKELWRPQHCDVCCTTTACPIPTTGHRLLAESLRPLQTPSNIFEDNYFATCSLNLGFTERNILHDSRKYEFGLCKRIVWEHFDHVHKSSYQKWGFTENYECLHILSG